VGTVESLPRENPSIREDVRSDIPRTRKIMFADVNLKAIMDSRKREFMRGTTGHMRPEKAGSEEGCGRSGLITKQ
jgi:hypothetical protein